MGVQVSKQMTNPCILVDCYVAFILALNIHGADAKRVIALKPYVLLLCSYWLEKQLQLLGCAGAHCTISY